MQDTDKIRKDISAVLGSEDAIQLCMLFGSLSTGRMNSRSDVDIAIAGKEAFDPEFLVTLQLNLSKAIGREVDILDLNRIGGLIKLKIFESGTVLINRDTALTERFINSVISYSSDVLPYVKMILHKRAARFTHGF